MDARAIHAAQLLIGQYTENGICSFENKRNQLIELFNDKKVPDVGWSECDIEILLHNISMMDSNNFSPACGVGERESRFASNIVGRRHYRMGHGIGRSGYITELQPKAVGSSLLNRLTNEFVLDILKSFGAPSTKSCIMLPLATGMCLTMCLLTLRAKRPHAKFVIWPRIDQKSCFKCILTAGYTPIIIDCQHNEGELFTDTECIRRELEDKGANNILCVITTTSCFAPRNPDNLEEVARICVEFDVPHLINNAYGVQCKTYMQMIEKASKIRVDAYVFSTDKNFMVPVGGSVVASFCKEFIDEVGKTYPGRASCSPTIDLFITLLNIGKKGYQRLLEERSEHFEYLRSELEIVARKFGERVLHVCNNQLSLALTLEKFRCVDERIITEIGSMLFSKFVSGARVVESSKFQAIGKYGFIHWGCHSSSYPYSYLTAAATIGVTRSEIDLFIKRLNEVLLSAQKTVVQMNTSCLNLAN